MSRLQFIIIAPIAFLVAGCSVRINGPVSIVGSDPVVQGNGIASAQTRATPQFHQVRSEGSVSVVITQGPATSVKVLGDSNIIPLVKTDVHDGVLTVMEEGSYSPRIPLTVQLTAPTVDYLTIDGSGNAQLCGLSQASLGVDINGSAGVVVDGTVDNLAVDISGSGSVQSRSLQARDTEVTISGSGSAYVTATGSIAADISGSGSVLYHGNPPVVTRNVTGSGSINAG